MMDYGPDHIVDDGSLTHMDKDVDVDKKSSGDVKPTHPIRQTYVDMQKVPTR